MSFCFFFPLQSGDGIQTSCVLGKCFTGEFHAPVLSWIILYHERKMILLEKAGKKPKGSQFRGETNQRLPTDEAVTLYSQGSTNHQTCTEWPPSIFSRCGFLQNPIVDSFQPQNRCLALLPFKKELLLSILQCLGYLKLLLP